MRRLYRVTATYPKYGGGTWTWTRHYLTKRAAETMAERRRTGWTHEGIGWDEDDVVVEPALSVQIDASDPITWSVDA